MSDQYAILDISSQQNSRPGELLLSYEGQTWTAKVDNICTKAEFLNIQWYVEEYTSQDPFRSFRAAEAVESIKRYGSRLAKCLQLERCSSRDGRPELRIHVRSSTSSTADNNPILWETLEDITSWSPPRCTTAVSVLRLGAPKPRDLPVTMYKRLSVNVLNVLVVSARPQSDLDIPHRLVSRIILDAAMKSGRNVRVEIVRPGTFEAFEVCMQEGQFDVVHFDVHGLLQNGSVKLGFLQATPSGFTTHLVEAASVAKTLAKHEVKHVVINACRSAFGSASDGNIALALLENGVHSVTAMSYSISSSSVEHFTQSFYASLFSGSEVSTCVSHGRLSLRENTKKHTQYGEELDVIDYFIPLHYEHEVSGSTSFEIAFNDEIHADLMEALRIAEKFIVGRENEILELENNLLLNSNIGVLSGSAGVGKTSLLQFLSVWWTMTRFIDHTIWIEVPGFTETLDDPIDFSRAKSWLAQKIWDDENRADDVVDYLRDNRVLFVVDGLESWVLPKDSNMRSQRSHFKKFLQAVHGSQCRILISSRKSEGWLDNLDSKSKKNVFSYHVPGLKPLKGLRLAQILISRFTEDRTRKQTALDDVVFLEQIIKLADGNPLALRIFMKNLVSTGMTPKDFYLAVLKGLILDVEDDTGEIGNSSARLISEYAKLVKEMFEDAENSKEKQRENHLYKIIKNEPLLPSDFQKNLPPTLFSFTWSYVAPEDLWSFVLFLSLEALQSAAPGDITLYLHSVLAGHKGNVPTSGNIELIKTAILFSNDVDMANTFVNSAHGGDVKILCQRLITRLLSAGFLEHETRASVGMPKKLYIKVHPLLPILARSTEGFEEARDLLRKTFVSHMSYSMRTWPHDYMYWNAIWEQPKLELGLDFANYLATALIAADFDPKSLAVDISLLQLVVYLPKGSFRDHSRYMLFIEFCKLLSVRSRNLYQSIRSGTLDASGYRLMLRLIEPSLIGATTQEDFVHNYLEVLFVTQLALSNTAVIQSDANSTDRSERELRIKETHDLVRQQLDKYENFYFSTNKLLKTWIDTLRYSEVSLGFLDADGVSKEWWQARQTFMRNTVAARGVETFPESQKTAFDLPYNLNSMSVPFAAYVDLIPKVRMLSKTRNFAAARKLIMDTMDFEVNYSVNLDFNKARLFEMLAFVDRKEEQWEDAISNLNRAYEHKMRMSPALPIIERVRYEIKLSKLYEKVGDSASCKYYVYLLLTRANEAAKENDTFVELLCLRCLYYKLERTRSLDSEVSTIFLFVRAAAAAHRLDATKTSAKTAKTVFTAQMLKIANRAQPLWVYGPVDPRPHTLAIAYLYMIFGQVINLPLCNRVPKLLSEKNYEKNYSEVALELEQRVFGETGTRMTYRYFLKEQDWEPQRKLFELFRTYGMSYLRGELPLGSVEDQWPTLPWTPSTLWGTVSTNGLFGRVATPEDYTLPTKIMLELSGYIVDEPFAYD